MGLKSSLFAIAVSAGMALGASGGVAAGSFGEGDDPPVFRGPSGRLLYMSRPSGDRVMDFSTAGFRSADASIPEVVGPVVRVRPGRGDDTVRIQAAIDRVSGLEPGEDGFRGVVELAAGEFEIGSRLLIRASGVVLRGAGDGESGGTVLRATGTEQRSVIMIGTTPRTRGDRIGPTRSVAEERVPVGARSFSVDDADGLEPGDRVLITRFGNEGWIAAIGMDRIPARHDGRRLAQWTPDRYQIWIERTLTHVDGDRVFFDAALPSSIERRFGGATLVELDPGWRTRLVGIEGIRGVSDFDTDNPEDEDHAWSFIEFRGSEDCWARGVTARHFGYAAVFVNERSRRVTVRDAVSIDPVSRVTGGRRYPFTISGSELVLMRDLRSDSGRHCFVFNTPAHGPNVFLDGVSTDARSETGPHQRWSTGGLMDSLTVRGDRIAVYNRGNFGSGHGWAGANMVIWNCEADGFRVSSPPTAQNWLLGSRGTITTDYPFGPEPGAIVSGHGEMPEPRSLYLAQLADRRAAAGAVYLEYPIGGYDGAVMGASGNDVPLRWRFSLPEGTAVRHAVLTVATGPGDTDARVMLRDGDGWKLAGSDDRTVFVSRDDAAGVVLVMRELGESELGELRGGVFETSVRSETGVDWARLELFAADSDVD